MTLQVCPLKHMHDSTWWRFLYLKAIKGSIILKCQDMVRDGEDVTVCSDQTPEVDGFSCWHDRWHTDLKLPVTSSEMLLCPHVMTDFSAAVPGSSTERFFISHWTMSAPVVQRRTLVRSDVTRLQQIQPEATICKHKTSFGQEVFVLGLCSEAEGQSCQSWVGVNITWTGLQCPLSLTLSLLLDSTMFGRGLSVALGRGCRERASVRQSGLEEPCKGVTQKQPLGERENDSLIQHWWLISCTNTHAHTHTPHGGVQCVHADG